VPVDFASSGAGCGDGNALFHAGLLRERIEAVSVSNRGVTIRRARHPTALCTSFTGISPMRGTLIG
jgi:hypothetical protein